MTYSIITSLQGTSLPPAIVKTEVEAVKQAKALHYTLCKQRVDGLKVEVFSDDGHKIWQSISQEIADEANLLERQSGLLRAEVAGLCIETNYLHRFRSIDLEKVGVKLASIWQMVEAMRKEASQIRQKRNNNTK